MAEFTRATAQRDKRRWPYAHMLVATNGNVLIETVHGSESSLYAEVLASASRIRSGEPNRGGEVAGSIVVDGVAEERWRGWLNG